MRASIVVLTYDQLEDGTRPCIESIFKFTDPDEFELIIVDNASKDGTQDYLRQVKDKYNSVKIILNDTNKGYAGGNNDGIRAATGDWVILLNNDTLVTPDWLNSLLDPALSDPSIGLIGPITNSAGNEQTVALPHLNLENHIEIAGQYTRRNHGYIFKTEKLGFYCVAISRSVIDGVGELDEKFGIGMFEDDDYCVRAKKQGYSLYINEGCFIYHKGSLSFKKMLSEEYNQIFERNREYFVRKNGEKWLFNQLTMAYFNQMEREIRMLQADSEINLPQIERVTVRLAGFRYLIENAMAMEKGSEKGDQMRKGKGKARRALSKFKNEFLMGTKQQRRSFLRELHRRLRPLKNTEIIAMMGEVRKKERFDRVFVFPATFDFHRGEGRSYALARSLAKQGQLVLFGTMNREDDLVEVCEKVEDHLYLVNQNLFSFLSHMATPDEMVFFLTGPGALTTYRQLVPKRTILDLEEMTDEAAGRYSTANSDILRAVELFTAKDDVATKKWTKLLGIKVNLVPANVDAVSIDALVAQMVSK